MALAAPGTAKSSAGRDSAEEITAFHEQLGLWRLARDARRGHHGKGSPGAPSPFERAVVHARPTELLAARPASPGRQVPARAAPSKQPRTRIPR